MLDLTPIKTRLAAATPGPWAEHDQVPCVPVSLSVDPNMSLLEVDRDGTAHVDSRGDAEFVIHSRADIEALVAEVERLRKPPAVRPLDEWREDHGTVLWWKLPICEPPYAGTPLDSDWPGYHTHWTAIAVPNRDGGP